MLELDSNCNCLGLENILKDGTYKVSLTYHLEQKKDVKKSGFIEIKHTRNNDTGNINCCYTGANGHVSNFVYVLDYTKDSINTINTAVKTSASHFGDVTRVTKNRFTQKGNGYSHILNTSISYAKSFTRNRDGFVVKVLILDKTTNRYKKHSTAVMVKL